MDNIKIDISKTLGFASKEMVNAYHDEIKRCNAALHSKTGRGNDFVGWVNLPSATTDKIVGEINDCAKKFKNCEVVIVIGIGGSYLGSKAVIEALSHSFAAMMPSSGHPSVVFAGQNIGEDYTSELLDLLENKKYGIVVISKSGTTTEPAVAFRIFKAHLEKKVGKAAAKDLIVAITDAKRGALRTLASQEGYQTFVIPDDVGGRYSVLTPVGLLPIAIAGSDIKEFVKGMQSMEKICDASSSYDENPAAIYAAARNALYKKGKKVEILVNFNQKLNYISEWWKQLYGESEGKENVGIFPASVNFTADLHSMGQYIQEGERHIFETVLAIKEPNRNISVPTDKDNLDGMNFLANKRIDQVNKMAELGTLIAHVDGGVPNIRIELPKLNEFYLGQLLYFFEKACGISGYILGINPFDQPGVEAYKKNMFALLEKPGFEEESKKIKERLKK
jgi:glucose-6-phosphate isomerase